MLLMPGSWGWSRGLVPFQADHGSFPQSNQYQCDSRNRTQTGSARAHTQCLFPSKGKRNLLQRFQACFLKCHFCKSPGPVTVFWRGGTNTRNLALLQEIPGHEQVWATRESSMKRKFNFPWKDLLVPTASSKQKSCPHSLQREEGTSQPGHKIPALVRAPELSTHKLKLPDPQLLHFFSHMGQGHPCACRKRRAQHKNLAVFPRSLH